MQPGQRHAELMAVANGSSKVLRRLCLVECKVSLSSKLQNGSYFFVFVYFYLSKQTRTYARHHKDMCQTDTSLLRCYKDKMVDHISHLERATMVGAVMVTVPIMAKKSAIKKAP